MLRKQKKDIENPFKATDFPIISEHGQPKAIIVDIQKCRELELLLDNLINLREEDEDAVIRDSGVLEKLITKAKEESVKLPHQSDWADEIDAL